MSGRSRFARLRHRSQVSEVLSGTGKLDLAVVKDWQKNTEYGYPYSLTKDSKLVRTGAAKIYFSAEFCSPE